MPGSDKYATEVFFSAQEGVNSGLSPDLISTSQNAWSLNATNRGGKPATRPPITGLGYLPEGLVQGAGYFSIQNGMMVVSISGNLYRLRIGPRSFTTEQIPLSFQNAPNLKEAWFCETVGTLVIQDGQSNPILYDGSVATRSIPAAFGVPLGRQMAYGNGRLWVAVAGNQLVAGDIVTDAPGSELLFTETNYLSGGGALRFPDDIRGLAFSPMPNIAEYGPLLVFGTYYAKAVRADITARDLWAQIPAFVSGVLQNIGSSGQNSITPVNQDLYWRDSQGGIRSLSSALVDESSAGSVPLSREVSRIVDFESDQYLSTASSVYFDNRFLTLASPFINPNGGISFKHIVPLDFAPISSMRGKSPPAYDGAWSGAQFTQLVTGKIAGRERCFGISSDEDGNNRLWEIHIRGISDRSEVGDSPIVAYLETARRGFGAPKVRKKLIRCDVYLSGIEKTLSMQVYWRPDNQQKWLQWSEEAQACAQMTDPATNTPHVWKNLLPQERVQVKTFTIPTEFNDISKYAMSTPFEVQLRIAWTGKARIERVLLHGQEMDDQIQANRDLLTPQCVMNDVTGNTITYTIPIFVRPDSILITEDGVDIETEEGLLLGTG